MSYRISHISLTVVAMLALFSASLYIFSTHIVDSKESIYITGTNRLLQASCLNMPNSLGVYQSDTFSYVMPSNTFGIVVWWPYSYTMNQNDERFPGNIALNAQGRFLPKVTTTQKVYQCQNEQEISTVVQCLPTGNVLSVRGGGHDFNGASLIGDQIIGIRDLTKQAQLLSGKKVVVSANIRNGELYKFIKQTDPTFNVVAGSCPTVEISGYTLGGGHGFMTNYYGITAHYLESVRMVLPNGTISEINDSNAPDLMWALRGGGHNLGVVTQFSFNYNSIPNHNWHLVFYSNENANKNQLASAIRIFNQEINNGAYYLSGLHFGYNSWNGAVILRLWALAPAQGPDAVTSEFIVQNIEQKFVPFTGMKKVIIFNDKDYHYITYTNIGEYASLTTEYNYANRNLQTSVNLQWTSVESTGIADNMETLLGSIFPILPERVQLNNYRYKHTGPYSKKSIYSPFDNSAYSDVSFMAQIYDSNQYVCEQITKLFKTNGLIYPNYPITYQDTTEASYFGSSAQKWKQVKQKYDPQGKFANKYTFTKSQYNY